MAKSGGSRTFVLAATILIADRKQADQPTANNCSGLVPVPEDPGTESLTSKWPSEVRHDPPSRPPVVWAWAVWRTFSIGVMAWVMACSPSSESCWCGYPVRFGCDIDKDPLCGVDEVHMVRTMRNCALPLIMMRWAMMGWARRLRRLF